MSTEIWKSIEGYEGLYEVSNLGRVRSLDKIDSLGRLHRGKIKNTQVNFGYCVVMLFNKKRYKNFRIHRLVAKAFIPNPDNLPCVNHKDEDKTNNCVDNLEWCDHLYNNNYGTKKERISLINTNNPKISKKINQYSLDGFFIKQWPSMMDIERSLGYESIHISQVSRHLRKSAYGYIWKYAS